MGVTLASPRPQSRVTLRGDITGARVFQVALALFIGVAVARIQEAVPLLGHFFLGKVLFLPMFVATLTALPRWQLLSSLGTRPGKCVSAIVGLCILSIPASIWPANSARFFILALVPQLVLFVVTAAGFAHRPTARFCMVCLVGCAGFDALYVASGYSPSMWGRGFIGTGLDPNESAAFFVCMLPFAIALADERGARRWLGLLTAMLLVAGTARTSSRGGLVGLIVVAAITIIQAARKAKWARIIGILACSGAFALTASDTLVERFQTMLEPETDYNMTDADGRIETWRRGMGYMIAHPLVGIGLAGFETAEGTFGQKVNQGYGVKYSAAHNAFVQIGAELGVFGLAAFVAALWSAAVGCRRAQRLAMRHRLTHPRLAEREANLCGALICALAAITTTGFFLSFAYHPLTLFILAACAGVSGGATRAWQEER